jgi:myo-inositol-1(or 4)-monophosphatase
MTARTHAAVERLVRKAGRMSLAAYGRDRGTIKRDLTWVTPADLAIEGFLRAALHELMNVRVFGEEKGWSGRAEAACIAIVDPIDGTEAYRHRMPFWGISVAVLERAGDVWTPAVGVFHMPACGHTFVGRAGKSFWNGKPLRMAKPRSPIPEECYLGVSSDAIVGISPAIQASACVRRVRTAGGARHRHAPGRAVDAPHPRIAARH